MSHKGNCLDNACMEGLFGHIKDEFSAQGLKRLRVVQANLEAYIVHWNTQRRQAKPKGLTPEEFRSQSSPAA